mmetsp:Transcript_102670/g.257363  ORF Transcript_102670/g.257363 Transcript_102670/m.257363 type:complete len:216 (+) Transcript_102670:463-1110(+)
MLPLRLLRLARRDRVCHDALRLRLGILRRGRCAARAGEVRTPDLRCGPSARDLPPEHSGEDFLVARGLRALPHGLEARLPEGAQAVHLGAPGLRMVAFGCPVRDRVDVDEFLVLLASEQPQQAHVSRVDEWFNGFNRFGRHAPHASVPRLPHDARLPRRELLAAEREVSQEARNLAIGGVRDLDIGHQHGRDQRPGRELAGHDGAPCDDLDAFPG